MKVLISSTCQRLKRLQTLEGLKQDYLLVFFILSIPIAVLSIFLKNLYLISFLILFLGTIDDFLSKKIHNKLILFFLPLVLICTLFIYGPHHLITVSLLSALAALVIALPLFYLKVFGGGDTKLFFILALTWNFKETLWTLIYAFPIGLIFGILRTLFQGKGGDFYKNLISLIQFKKPDQKKLQTFPFSIMLLFGWITFLVVDKLN